MSEAHLCVRGGQCDGASQNTGRCCLDGDVGGWRVASCFFDYLLVTGNIVQALMTEIYDKTFVKKLKLGPANIPDWCMGVAFDGQCFHLGCPRVFLKYGG